MESKSITFTYACTRNIVIEIRYQYKQWLYGIGVNKCHQTSMRLKNLT